MRKDNKDKGKFNWKRFVKHNKHGKNRHDRRDRCHKYGHGHGKIVKVFLVIVKDVTEIENDLKGYLDLTKTSEEQTEETKQ